MLHMGISLVEGKELLLNLGILSFNCRTQWGRGLATTLLSGLTTALNPASITLVWCDHLDTGNLPSLLYNLRMSRNITILTLPTQLQVGWTAALLSNIVLPARLVVAACSQLSNPCSAAAILCFPTSSRSSCAGLPGPAWAPVAGHS
jgi:hypothetical protein